MNKLVGLDMIGEELGQEVKNRVAKYLRTTERVSRAVLGILLGSIDSLVNHEDISFNMLGYGVIFIIAEKFLQSHRKENDGAITIDIERMMCIFFRFLAIIGTLIHLPSGNAGPLFYGAYSYIAINIHDSEGKSIGDMVKNTVKKKEGLQKT